MRLRLLFVSLLVSAALLSNAAVAGNIAHGVSVVVIGPGHGGRLPGAHYGSIYEKDLVLKVGLRLGKLIEEGMPGVKVVYTRTTDKMLGATLAEDLQKRADIANEAGGDLFISIHANAAAATAAKGVEVLIMGETPKEQRYNTEALYESNREDLIDLATEPNAAIVRARIQNLQITYGEYSMAIARCIERSFREAGPGVPRGAADQAAAAARALRHGHAGRARRDRLHVQCAGDGLHEVRAGPGRDRPQPLRRRAQLFGLRAHDAARRRRGGRGGCGRREGGDPVGAALRIRR